MSVVETSIFILIQFNQFCLLETKKAKHWQLLVGQGSWTQLISAGSGMGYRPLKDIMWAYSVFRLIMKSLWNDKECIDFGHGLSPNAHTMHLTAHFIVYILW